MNIIYEPYSYDEILSHMEDGKVETLIEIDRAFYLELQAAEERTWQGDVDAADELYDELAEKVIGNQWCYFGLQWEDSNEEPLDARENLVIKVTVEPDLTE